MRPSSPSPHAPSHPSTTDGAPLPEPVPGHITAAGAVIYRPSRGFLLIRNRDYWEFPKGRVEESKDKDILATAAREIGEETGLTDVRFVEGFHEVERFRVQRGPKDVHMYLGVTAQEPTISSEHRGYCWVYPHEIPKFLSYETKRVIFRKALAHLRARGLLRPEDEIKPGRSLRPNHGPKRDGNASGGEKRPSSGNSRPDHRRR